MSDENRGAGVSSDSPWEVREGAYSGTRGEFSVWPVGSDGNGDHRIACWIRTREVAEQIVNAHNERLDPK